VVIFPVGRYHEPARRIVLDIGAKLKRAGTNIGNRAADRIFQTSYEVSCSRGREGSQFVKNRGSCSETGSLWRG
jgi:hypothetical protein